MSTSLRASCRVCGKNAFLAVLAVLAVLPFLWLLYTSVRSGDIYAEWSGWQAFFDSFTLDYYWRFLAASDQMSLWRFLGNTLVICVCGVTLEVGLASLAGYPLARIDFPGKGIVAAVLAATLMLPTQANMIVNFATIRFLGLFDTLVAVFLPSAVSVFGIFLMRQAFLVIPRELEDAARVDGCGEWRLFWNVMLPLTRASQGTLALFAFVAHWNSFMWPLVVLKRTEHFPLSLGMAYMAETFDADFRLVAAGSILATIPLVLVFLAIQKQFIQGITAGAIK